MTRIVTFADGFDSVSPPSVQGVGQESFPILNNQSAFANFVGLILDSNAVRTAFVNYEVERQEEVAAVLYTYKQSGELMFVFDGTAWNLTYGNFVPSPIMIQEAVLTNPYDLIFNIDMTTGQVGYKSGEMLGDNYFGQARFSITRILA